MTTEAPQDDSPDGVVAGQTDTASTDTNETPDGEPNTDTPDNDADEHDDDGGLRSHEAAKYRRRLRETEAERDQLRKQLDSLHQSIVDGIATAAGVDARLLSAAGHQLADFINDDGTVDGVKVSQACADAAQQFGITPKGRPPRPNPQQGVGAGNKLKGTSWAQALNSARS